jgi:hypothetical protein
MTDLLQIADLVLLLKGYLMMHSADSCELYEKETALSMMVTFKKDTSKSM